MIGTISLTLLLAGGQGKAFRAGLEEGRSLMLNLPPLAQNGQILALKPAITLAQQPAAPELVAAKGEWIQKPTTMKGLKGKVVLVDFWAYTCVNCIRTFPYLNEWYRRYHDKGFEIVAVHRPEFDFEGEPKNVAAATKRFGFKFPVLNDLESKNWTNYGVTAWPTKMLVDGNGKIVYAHVGEGSYDEMERQIQKHLALVNPKLKFVGTMAPVRPTDAPGAVCHPSSLEAFVASTRIAHFTADQRNKKTLFTYPAKKMSGIYYSGYWTPTKSYSEASANSAIFLHYMAKDVNSVIRTSVGPVLVEVYQDGKPLDKADLGDDVKMIDGMPTMKVVEPRMYSVVRNRHWGMHDFELRFKNPGARLYTFTFGTECRPLAHRKK